MKPANAIFLVLLAACALLGAGIVGLWMGLGQGIRPAPSQAAATPAAAAAGASEEFQLPAYDTYAEVIQRPLFNDDRRPRVISVDNGDDPDGGDGPEIPDVELNVAVTGIIITPTTQLAMVTNNVSKESLRMKVGMALDGEQANWTLTDIEPRRLVFSGGSQGTAEVKLETFTQALKGGAAPPPRRNVVTQTNKTEGEPGDNAAPAAADTDSDRAARAEEIRRRVAERRAQLREEAERRRAEANLDEENE